MELTEKQIEDKINEYMGLIKSTAHRYNIDGMDFEDVVQELTMQFVKALKVYDETKGATIKTLFIKYANMWAYDKLILNNRKKHSTMVLTLDNEAFGEEDYGWIENLQDNKESPDELDYKERMSEHILEFLKTDNCGDTFYRHVVNGETFAQIAKDEGVTFQAIHTRYKRVLKDLKKYLQEMGYELE